MSDIRDITPLTGVRLTEAAGKGGRKALVVEGIFQKADTLNANQRIYPKALWNKILGSDGLKEALSRRRMFGECDHPSDWRMALARTSHVVTDLRMDESGNVIGKAEILPTPTGIVLEAILRSGCEVGISSRGTGSTSRTNEGHEVVGEDYQLETFDFVATPSTPGAYPKMVQESLDRARKIEHELSAGFTTSAPAKEEGPKMDLGEYRALEREASKLVRMKTKGLDETALEMLRDRLDETIVRIVKASEDKSLAALSENALASLKKKRASLVAEEIPPQFKSKSGSSASASDSDDDDDSSDKDEAADNEMGMAGSADGSSPMEDNDGGKDSGPAVNSPNTPAYAGKSPEFAESKKEITAHMNKFEALFAEEMPAFLSKEKSSSDSDSDNDSDDSAQDEDEESAAEVTADINANLSAEAIDRRLSNFLREEGSSSSSSSSKSDKDEDGEAAAYAPDAPSQSGDDIVTATEAEIKGLAKAFAKHPEKLESFLRGVIRTTNRDRKARKVAEARALRFGMVAEAVANRYKDAKGSTAIPASKYRFVCEAVAELQKRYLALRAKVSISERLESVPVAERAAWVNTLSTLTTPEQLEKGIKKVLALYTKEDAAAEYAPEKPQQSAGAEDLASASADEVSAKAESKTEPTSPILKKRETLITEGAHIFTKAREKSGSLR